MKPDCAPSRSGRALFERRGRIIRFVCAVVAALPRSGRQFLWRSSMCGDSKIEALIRYAVLASLCRSIGSNVYIGPNVVVKNPHRLNIGNNVSVHFGSYIDAIGGCDIGNDVSIAHMSSIISFEHTWDDQALPIKYNPVRLGSVRVGNDVWVGCGVRILSGTTIGDRVVIAAGSVVRGDCPSFGVFAGVPVRRIKSLEPHR